MCDIVTHRYVEGIDVTCIHCDSTSRIGTIRKHTMSSKIAGCRDYLCRKRARSGTAETVDKNTAGSPICELRSFIFENDPYMDFNDRRTCSAYLCGSCSTGFE